MEPADAIEHREAWDKREGESQKAFSAFCLYRDAEKRSFKIVAEQLKCSPQNIFQWSSKFNWRLRVDAFDIDQDRQQREDFARNRVRMRDRHLRLSLAMQSVAAHALREWQSRIASGGALNLAPEQIALLTKCAVELERNTLGIDGEHRPPVINVLIGTHRYNGEKAGDSGVVVEGEDEAEWASWQDVERIEYERLSPSERAALDTWKVPPKPKALN
jgi:hypothetical protein